MISRFSHPPEIRRKSAHLPLRCPVTWPSTFPSTDGQYSIRRPVLTMATTRTQPVRKRFASTAMQRQMPRHLPTGLLRIRQRISAGMSAGLSTVLPPTLRYLTDTIFCTASRQLPGSVPLIVRKRIVTHRQCCRTRNQARNCVSPVCASRLFRPVALGFHLDPPPGSRDLLL